MIYTEVQSDDSEIIHYNYPEIPLYARRSLLSEYPGMAAIGHWHEDLEFIVILQGKMAYSVNGNDYLLEEGQGIFVNSRQFHYGHSFQQMDCDFLCIILPLTLLNPPAAVKDTYITPLLESNHYPFCILNPIISAHMRVLEQLKSILILCQKQEPAFELELEGIIFSLWKLLYEDFVKKTDEKAPEESLYLDELRHMVSFIQNHYSEKIMLEQIAAAGNICRSGCCKLFQNVLHTSPIAYVINYRIHKSIDLLLYSKLTVTEIAYYCGFSNTSYYIKVFKRATGLSPLEYRRSKNSTKGNHLTTT